MSHYATVELQETGSVESLVRALCTLGWSKEHIEVHEARQSLRDYHGMYRPQKAHVIIRKANVWRGAPHLHEETASNDVGFERDDNGRWTAHISDFDRSYCHFEDAWKKKFLSKWAQSKTEMQAEEKRYRYHTEENEQHITVRIMVP